MKIYFRVHIGFGKWVDTKPFEQPEEESSLPHILRAKKDALRKEYPTGVICLKTEE